MVLKFKSMSLNKTLYHSLKEIISMRLSKLEVDQREVLLKDITIHNKIIGEEFNLHFDNGSQLVISTEDFVHFFGDGELTIVAKIKQKEKQESTDIKDKISRIRIWRWRFDGINIFATKSVCQLVFFSNEEIILSVGFFYPHENQMSYISNGELCISKLDLNKENLGKDIVYEDIS